MLFFWKSAKTENFVLEQTSCPFPQGQKFFENKKFKFFIISQPQKAYTVRYKGASNYMLSAELFIINESVGLLLRRRARKGCKLLVSRYLKCLVKDENLWKRCSKLKSIVLAINRKILESTPLPLFQTLT